MSSARCVALLRRGSLFRTRETYARLPEVLAKQREVTTHRPASLLWGTAVPTYVGISPPVSTRMHTLSRNPVYTLAHTNAKLVSKIIHQKSISGQIARVSPEFFDAFGSYNIQTIILPDEKTTAKSITLSNRYYELEMAVVNSLIEIQVGRWVKSVDYVLQHTQ